MEARHALPLRIGVGVFRRSAPVTRVLKGSTGLRKVSPVNNEMTELSIERRAKRHVWSRDHDFLAVCAPGLEAACRAELSALDSKVLTVIRGGVAFAGRLEAGYSANLWLRSAGRVLMRVDRFRAGAYEEIFSKSRKMYWETLLAPGALLSFRTVVRYSRAGHTERVEKAILDGIQARFNELGLKRPMLVEPEGPSERLPEVQEVYVRMEGNQCLLSLDMSGPPLHFRGYRKDVHHAPIRETMAAGLLLLMGWRREEPLLDPMCGSGAFPIEAALMGHNRAPGLRRDFAFTRWPCFRPKSWEYLLREAAKSERNAPPLRLLGRDRDPDAIRAAEENFRRTGIEHRVAFETADFFQTKAPFDSGVLAINPPYGKRVSTGSDPAKLYREIGRKIRADYGGWRVLILVPGWRAAQALHLNPRSTVLLDHGGFPVLAVMTDAVKTI
ncbi:MAG: hypothetical protein HY788_02440 [Deltaproteobacteria bacterium]|nr:hypothetical protein [Deltaproteobacteria bacterium]